MKKNPKNTKTPKLKPVEKILPMIFTGKDQRGQEYDVESCKNILIDLQTAKCFEKLSVSISLARSFIGDENALGSVNFGRFNDYNIDTEEVTVLILGKNIENADIVTDMVVVPRVRVARDSTEVTSILGFDIVPAMDA